MDVKSHVYAYKCGHVFACLKNVQQTFKLGLRLSAGI